MVLDLLEMALDLLEMALDLLWFTWDGFGFTWDGFRFTWEGFTLEIYLCYLCILCYLCYLWCVVNMFVNLFHVVFHCFQPDSIKNSYAFHMHFICTLYALYMQFSKMHAFSFKRHVLLIKRHALFKSAYKMHKVHIKCIWNTVQNEKQNAEFNWN